MLANSLNRSIASVQKRLVLLAPPTTRVPVGFDHIDVNPQRHAELLAEMQRLRGGIYFDDGALDRQHLSADGLHQTPEDEQSWHLLMLDSVGRIDACIWYMEHAPTVAVDRLRVKHCPLADEPIWRDTLLNAVEQDLAAAQRDGLGYAEVGGWAVAERNRCTSEGLVLALASYSLGRMLGGALGMTTATVRHCSSTILRRLGGSDLRADGRIVPSYYDPRYKCEMELLRFDSRQPSSKYASFVDLLKDKLAEVLVIARSENAIVRPGDGFIAPGAARQRAALAA
jgi:hypothetical protein